MALLDNITEDENPLVITLDFSQYENGAKYSTLMRTYFDKYKVALNIDSMEEYVAHQLLCALKVEQRAELKKDFLDPTIAELKSQFDAAKTAANETDTEIAQQELKKI